MRIFKALLYLVVSVSLFTACSKSDDGTPPPAPGEAKMTKFGFYVEDNLGVISKDYEVAVSGSAISVFLPVEADKANLVARFVVTENDVVTVGGVAQLSGVTANDFNVPLDYLVTEGKSNKSYTVTVKKITDGAWAKIATLISDSVVSSIMKIDPMGTPYFAYVHKTTAPETDVDKKLYVYKLVDNAFKKVGSNAGISAGRTGEFDITFTPSGVPYVCYGDYTVATPTPRLSVQSLNGGTWTPVGGALGLGITDVNTTYQAIAINPEGQPMTFSMNNAVGALVKRELNISAFDGSSWSSNNQMPNRPSTQFAYFPKTKIFKNALYLGIFNASGNPQTFSIYKRENASWTTVADKIMGDGAMESYLADFDMDLDSEGNIYVAIADSPDKSVYRPRIMKYTAATQLWSTVGAIIPIDFSKSKSFSLAISPSNTPYFAYLDEAKLPTVIYLDSETKQWSDPVVLESLAMSDIYIDFAPNGTPYVSYVNSSNRIVVQKFE